MIFLISTPDDITTIVNEQRLGIEDISVALNMDSLADVLGITAHGAESDDTSEWPLPWFPLRASKIAPHVAQRVMLYLNGSHWGFFCQFLR
jgi:hypothetical protein